MRNTFRAYHRAVDPNGIHTFVATSEGVKRDGLNLRMDGARLEDYMKNPVVLWAHDYRGNRPPIGRAEHLEKTGDGKKLRARVRFDMADPFAAEIDRKYREGYLNAVSIGWNPLDSDSWELLDLSAVPVPGDADALIEREIAALRGLVGSDGSLGDDTIIEEAVSSSLPNRDSPGSPNVRGAIPPHSTPKQDEGTSWDGPREVAAAESSETAMRLMHAWVDSDMDPDTKRAYKLPHHTAQGEVNWRGTAAAMARLFQAGTQIPDADRQGVWRHLARHYRQFGKEPPEFRTLAELDLPADTVGGMFSYGEWGICREVLADGLGVAVETLKEAIAAYEQMGSGTTIKQGAPPDTQGDLAALLEVLPSLEGKQDE